jgi:hypothetical protein
MVSTEMFAGAIISVVQYLAPLGYVNWYQSVAQNYLLLYLPSVFQ